MMCYQLWLFKVYTTSLWCVGVCECMCLCECMCFLHVLSLCVYVCTCVVITVHMHVCHVCLTKQTFVMVLKLLAAFL